MHESEPYGTADGVKDSAECTVHGGQILQLQDGYESSMDTSIGREQKYSGSIKETTRE